MPGKRIRGTRRIRKRLRRKTQRGGGFPPLKPGAIAWPSKEGCVGNLIPITLVAGDVIDRFGPATGNYVSPVGETADRIAKILGRGEDQPNVYAYANRALPYAGVTDGGVEGDSLRKQSYMKTYKKNLSAGRTDYHQYRVQANDAVRGTACIVAPAFNTRGGGIQIRLEKPVGHYLGPRVLEEMPLNRVPAYSHGEAPIINKKEENHDKMTWPDWTEWPERPLTSVTDVSSVEGGGGEVDMEMDA
jgi:hypothetical protein